MRKHAIQIKRSGCNEARDNTAREIEGNNHLPVLAGEIKAAHAGVMDAATTAAERAIVAGKALIEAKALVKHGQWLPFLKKHCDLPERTAQLYMKIARLDLEPATVADLGIKNLAKMNFVQMGSAYNYFADLDEDDQRAWLLFCLLGIHPEHMDWCVRIGWKSPDEWLGPEGDEYRARFRWKNPSEEFKRRWAAFRDEHKDLSTEEIVERGNRKWADL